MQTQQIDSQAAPSAPLISFIVTAYNLPHELLAECVDSILAVDMLGAGREIIVVDDGSTVPVAALPDGVAVIRQSHAGPGAARNRGISAAHGRYLQFVDGDDFLLPPEYDHCVELVHKASPDMIMFSFNDGGQLRLTLFDSAPTTGSDYMLCHVFAGQSWRYLFRRSMLGDLRFPTDVFNHEDELFTSLLMLRPRLLYATTAEAYRYRRRDGSLTTPDSIAEKRQSQADFLKVISRLQKVCSSATGEERRALTHRLGQLSIDYLATSLRLFHDTKEMAHAADELRQLGLRLPPHGWYGPKYLLFSLLAVSRWGRWLLAKLTLKLLK